MADPRKIDVFVSYAARDKSWASKFVRELEARGVHAWSDKTEIAIGDDIAEKLEEALREAPVVAVLLSKDYLNSPWQAFELGAALAGQKKIIPIITHDTELPSLPTPLRNRQLLQEPSPQIAGQRVAEAVGHLLNPSGDGSRD